MPALRGTVVDDRVTSPVLLLVMSNGGDVAEGRAIAIGLRRAVAYLVIVVRP